MRFLEMAITTSNNVSQNEGGIQSRIFNFLWNASYTFSKRHNFNGNTIWQRRDITTRGLSESVTATVGYSYGF